MECFKGVESIKIIIKTVLKLQNICDGLNRRISTAKSSTTLLIAVQSTGRNYKQNRIYVRYEVQ